MSLKIYLVSFVAALVFISSKKEKFENHEFKDKYMHVTYQTKDGRMNGLYTSYYPTGIIKAQGLLENGFHKGTWIVQDSLGKVVSKREYSGPFNFKSVLPKVPRNPTVKLFDKPCYTPKRNKDGFFELFYLEENSIVAAKRIWRELPQVNNSILFNKNLLIELIDKSIRDSIITAYDTISDEFFKVLDHAVDIDYKSVTSFLIKEDWVFDNKRNMAENRIIGICPRVIDPSTGKPKNLFWIYYPELRAHLNQIDVNMEGREEIRNIDDVFFFRCFHSQILKESNVYDRSLADYTLPENMDREVERIELTLLEQEHTMWANQTFVNK